MQVWKFESDSTLADALSGNLGQWPEDIEEIMLGRVDETQPVEKREAAVGVVWRVGGELLVCVPILNSTPWPPQPLNQALIQHTHTDVQSTHNYNTTHRSSRRC
jgi:hypothetical protein